MPRDDRKCRMYIARITHRAAQRAAARVNWLKTRNRLDNKKGRVNNRRLFSLQTFAPMLRQGNPFAGKWPRRSDGAARTQRLYQRRYAGGVA